MGKIFCGIDWAERHHDIALVDEHGTLVAKKRIHETVEGWQQLLDLLAAAGDTPRAADPRGDRNPARPPGRGVTGHRSAGLRDQPDGGRPLPRPAHRLTQQDATWRRTKASNELRSLLREYYPAFLDAFIERKDYLASAEARAVLAIAPTPATAAKLTKTRIAAALRRGGRKRGVDDLAAQIQQALRAPHLRQQPLVEDAMGTAAPGAARRARRGLRQPRPAR